MTAKNIEEKLCLAKNPRKYACIPLDVRHSQKVNHVVDTQRKSKKFLRITILARHWPYEILYQSCLTLSIKQNINKSKR